MAVSGSPYCMATSLVATTWICAGRMKRGLQQPSSTHTKSLDADGSIVTMWPRVMFCTHSADKIGRGICVGLMRFFGCCDCCCCCI
jgi:hypothetical protein